MKELIDRLEKATGPDRELDGLIYRASDPVIEQCWPHWSPLQRTEIVPHYTSSIDAALTLVPKHWVRAVDATAPEMGIDVDLMLGADEVRGTHESEAIATCIAALKARQHSPAEIK